MIKELASIANILDKNGFSKKADLIDDIILKSAQEIEEIDESHENDGFIAALISVIDELKSRGNTPDNSKQIDILSKLLEDSL